MKRLLRPTQLCITAFAFSCILLMPATASAIEESKQDSQKTIEQLRAQNRLLEERSRFTTGGIAMILGIGAMLVFLTVNNRWNHRLEVKNRELERERNIVIAQNKQLAIERDRAEAALKAKTSFMQSMTHEIRTPLNAISGFTQVLTMPDIDLPTADRLELSVNIQENTQRLTNMLDEMILITDLESSTEIPEPESCMVASILAEAVEVMTTPKAPSVELNIKSSVPEDTMLHTHPYIIQQILVKLLDNAAKFTHEGSITLSLDVESDKLHFAVADTGPGIPADKTEYIFERFTKLDSFAQGTGLGLSAARLMAERLNGTLTLDTSYTGGSKFDLIIPTKPEA